MTEYKDIVTNFDWILVSSLAGNDTEQQLVDAVVGTAARRFYRVRVEN